MTAVLRRYLFKLYPTTPQAAELDRQRRMMAELWNALLQRCEDVYRRERRHLSFFDMTAEITGLRRECPEWAALSVWSAHRVARSLDEAFAAFFRRAKAGAGGQSGYPRYRPARLGAAVPHRFASGCKLSPANGESSGDGEIPARSRNWRLRAKGVAGLIRARGQLPAPALDWKDADILWRDGAWWLSVCVEMAPRLVCGDDTVSVHFNLIDEFARVDRVKGPRRASAASARAGAGNPNRINDLQEGTQLADDAGLGERGLCWRWHSRSRRAPQLADDAGLGERVANSRNPQRPKRARLADDAGLGEREDCVQLADDAGLGERAHHPRPRASSRSGQLADDAGLGERDLERRLRRRIEHDGQLADDAGLGERERAGIVDDGLALDRQLADDAGSGERVVLDAHGARAIRRRLADDAGLGERDAVLVGNPVDYHRQLADDAGSGERGGNCRGLADDAGSGERELVGVDLRRQPQLADDAGSGERGVVVHAAGTADLAAQLADDAGSGERARRGQDRAERPAAQLADDAGSGERVQPDLDIGIGVPPQLADDAGSGERGGNCRGLSAGSGERDRRVTEEDELGAAFSGAATLLDRADAIKSTRDRSRRKRSRRWWRETRRAARLTAKAARLRREALHRWTTDLIASAGDLTLIVPAIKTETKSPRGNVKQWGAAVEMVSALNRNTLNQAPAMARQMLAYKAAETGIRCDIVDDAEPVIAVGRDLVATGKLKRRARRAIKEAA